jgi:hypothetical protein
MVSFFIKSVTLSGVTKDEEKRRKVFVNEKITLRIDLPNFQNATIPKAEDLVAVSARWIPTDVNMKGCRGHVPK